MEVQLCKPREVARVKATNAGAEPCYAHELFYGFKGQRTPESLARVEALAFEVVEFDREDARTAGELRARLAKAGTPIGPYNVLIAGQAVARDLTLVTHNRGEFQRVVGLHLEDGE
jgi:tRNA(fMet)-specific endonuclease VapC